MVIPDAVWIEFNGTLKSSHCCSAAVQKEMEKAVAYGTCTKCGRVVYRLNPKTWQVEVPKN